RGLAGGPGQRVSGGVDQAGQADHLDDQAAEGVARRRAHLPIPGIDSMLSSWHIDSILSQGGSIWKRANTPEAVTAGPFGSRRSWIGRRAAAAAIAACARRPR